MTTPTPSRIIDLAPLNDSVRGYIADITFGTDIYLKDGRITWGNGEYTANVERLCQGLPDGTYRTSADRNDYVPPPNPWERGSFNLTKQLQIKREAPALARHLAGTHLDLPPRGRAGPIKLTNADEIRLEMVRVYREARTGKLEAQQATRLVYMLGEIRKAYETSVIERRITALEGSTHEISHDPA